MTAEQATRVMTLAIAYGDKLLEEEQAKDARMIALNALNLYVWGFNEENPKSTALKP